MILTALTLLSLSTPAQAAPIALVRDWSIISLYLDECPVTWNELINHDLRSDAGGADPVSDEYAQGYTDVLSFNEASVTLYDIDHIAIGSGSADPLGFESVSGDITGIEPTSFLPHCSLTTYPKRYFMRVYTTTNTDGFLVYVQ